MASFAYADEVSEFKAWYTTTYNKTLTKADADKDPKPYGQWMTHDYTYISADGRVENRSQVIENARQAFGFCQKIKNTRKLLNVQATEGGVTIYVELRSEAVTIKTERTKKGDRYVATGKVVENWVKVDGKWRVKSTKESENVRVWINDVQVVG